MFARRWRDFQSAVRHLSVKYLQFTGAPSAKPRWERQCVCLCIMLPPLEAYQLPHAWRLVAITPCGTSTVWADPELIAADWAYLAKWNGWRIRWQSLYKHVQTHRSIHPANVAKKSLCTFIHLLNTHFEGLKQIEIIQELIESHQHQYLTMRNWNSHPPWEFCLPGQYQVGAQPYVHSGGHPANRNRQAGSHLQAPQRCMLAGHANAAIQIPVPARAVWSCGVIDGASWVDVLQPWSSRGHFPFVLINFRARIYKYSWSGDFLLTLLISARFVQRYQLTVYFIC